MRRLMYLLIGILFSVTIFSCFLKAEEIWQLSSFNQNGLSGTKYSISQDDYLCNITAYDNGQLEIRILNHESGQFIIISPEGGIAKGGWKLEKGNRHGSDQDIFGNKFRRYALNLPPDVTKMFRGHWNIQ